MAERSEVKGLQKVANPTLSSFKIAKALEVGVDDVIQK